MAKPTFETLEANKPDDALKVARDLFAKKTLTCEHLAMLIHSVRDQDAFLDALDEEGIDANAPGTDKAPESL